MFRSPLILCLLLLAACAGEQQQDPTESPSLGTAPQAELPAWRYIEQGDLTEIRSRGILRVLAPARPEKEHLPRAEDPFERERELAAEYARELGLDLAYVPVDRPEDVIPWLLEGKGDVTLVKRPPGELRSEGVSYSVALKKLRELVVTRADGQEIQSLEDVAGLRIAVLRSGQLTRSLAELEQNLPGAEIVEVNGPFTPDDLLYRVGRGELEAALVDSNWWQVTSGYRSDLRIALELPAEHRVVAATRADSPELLESVNDFIVAATAGRRRRTLSTGDLPSIAETGALRVLIPNEAPSYFLQRGELRGFEYELAKEFASRQGLRLEIVVPPQRSDLIPWLLEGRADMVAADLHLTQDVPRRRGDSRLSRRSDGYRGARRGARADEPPRSRGKYDLRGFPGRRR